MPEILTPQDVGQILNAADLLKRARIFEGNTQKPFQVQKFEQTLTTAKTAQQALRIGFPFKSFWVQSATDTNVSVDIQIGTRDEFQSIFNVKKNDVFRSDYPITECYISWSAQASKSITIIFFTDADFQSGSLINQLSGGVSVLNGTSMATALVAAVATTAVQIFASDSTRLNGLVQNRSGGSIYLGANSSVNNTPGDSNRGIEIQDGQDFTWKNTAALYSYCDATGDIIKMTES